MATGTGNLPNPGMSFSPFAILTAEEQNDLVENIESLATGSGIGDGAVTTAKIANSAVTSAKIDFTTFPQNAADTEYRVPNLYFLGLPVYQKIVNFGALPNATSKSLNHGITGLQYFTDISGVAFTTGLTTLPLPFVNDANSTGGQVSILANGTQVVVNTTTNRTAYTTCYVTLQYTKT